MFLNKSNQIKITKRRLCGCVLPGSSFPFCVPRKLGSISPHWYFRHSGTPSQLKFFSWLLQLQGSSLYFLMNKNETFQRTPPFPPVLKRPQSRILFSQRRQNVALIRSASPRRSKLITEVNPNETDPSSAWWSRAEIENHAASKSDPPLPPNMFLAESTFRLNYKNLLS